MKSAQTKNGRGKTTPKKTRKKRRSKNEEFEVYITELYKTIKAGSSSGVNPPSP